MKKLIKKLSLRIIREQSTASSFLFFFATNIVCLTISVTLLGTIFITNLLGNQNLLNNTFVNLSIFTIVLFVMLIFNILLFLKAQEELRLQNQIQQNANLNTNQQRKNWKKLGF